MPSKARLATRRRIPKTLSPPNPSLNFLALKMTRPVVIPKLITTWGNLIWYTPLSYPITMTGMILEAFASAINGNPVNCTAKLLDI